jgi:hypothetical protein
MLASGSFLVVVGHGRRSASPRGPVDRRQLRCLPSALPSPPASPGRLHLLRQQDGLLIEDEALEALALAQSGGSIARVCAGLAAHGYPVEVRIYREIEAGLRLPKDPVRFLNAFT